jgi:AcrR family transcriptional regulator
MKDAARRIPGRRERHKLATREALLDATRALLASRSMDALTIDDIVMRADVARGTFYNYFRDKDALERELASRIRGRIEDQITRTNDGIADPARRIARAFCCLLRFCLSTPQQAVAMMKLFPRATDPKAPINAGARRDVASGIAQGRIVAPSEDIAMAFMMGVFVAGANRALDLKGGRVRAFATELGILLLHGFGLRRAEALRIMDDAAESVLAHPRGRTDANRE